MTARERAERAMVHHFASPERRTLTDDVAQAIEAAESAAYERAARALYDAPELAGVESRLIDPVYERIRALAKKGGEG